MKIVVLCGGTSTEREVSISSGEMVCGALRERGHDAVLADVFFGADKENFFGRDEYDTAAEAKKIRAMSGRVGSVMSERRSHFGPGIIEICSSADIVFNALHGGDGENGRISAAFDLFGIKYTGSGHLSSGMAMDKGITKKIFREEGIPTAKSVLLKKGDDTDLRVHGLSVPCVVKTCHGGSSIGVYITKTQDEYKNAVNEAFKFEDQVLVEQFIDGREFSAGVLGGVGLPVVEIIAADGGYNYENKYRQGGALEICPADLDEETEMRMRGYAERAVAALGLKVYARVDFLLDKDGNMFALEANNLPGMTQTSLLPKEAAAVGLDFCDLCEKIVKLSLEKYGDAI